MQRVWNRIPDGCTGADQIGLTEAPELSPDANWAVSGLPDTPRATSVSEASVYRLLKAHDPLTASLHRDQRFSANEFQRQGQNSHQPALGRQTSHT